MITIANQSISINDGGIGMTMISEKLAAEADYLAHFIGKWVSTPPHPRTRPHTPFF